MDYVVIMVWKQFLDAGFGDMLRGTIQLYNMSQRMNFKLIVDTQLHPVSKLLVLRKHMYLDYVLQNQSEIVDMRHIGNENLESVIRSKLRQDKPLLITTNCTPIDAMTNDCKRFMRFILHPTDEFKRYFIETRNKYDIPNSYAIAHFRLGDQELINDGSNTDINKYNELLQLAGYQMSKFPNLHIMSDSLEFKKHLCKRLRPEFIRRIIPTTPIHLSHPDAAADVENIKETMFDFMLLINAQFIKTHSKYEWISNFVKWVGHIFNVTVLDMKSPKVAATKRTNVSHQMQKHVNPSIPTPLFSRTTVPFRKMF
jgi:hypothetical protein